MASTSLLAFLVPRLVIQTENAVSDALYFILRENPQLAEALTDWLRSTEVPLPRDLSFATQVAWADSGRPDLIGSYGNTPVLLIESKFGAPLTDAQPVGYLRRLPPGNGILLFLTPENRVDEVWATIKKRCRAAQVKLDDATIYSHGLRFSRLRTGSGVAIAPWQSLLALLSETPNLTSAGSEDLRQLHSLVSGLLQAPPASNSEEDKLVREVRHIVDEVTRRLSELGHATLKGYRATPGPGYYKRYMSLHGHPNWCVEFNVDYWAKTAQSPIWLTVPMRPPHSPEYTVLASELGHLPRIMAEQLLIPLLAKGCQSEEEVIVQMTDQARTVASLLQPAPGELGT